MDNNINTFIFDCFGVICDPVLVSWYKHNRLEKGLPDPKIYDVLREFDLGKISEDQMAEYFLSYDGVNLTKEKIREEIDNYLKLDRKLVNTIQSLKDKGFKIVLLTNANASFFERKIYKLYPEFKDLFNEMIISSIVGMVKPDSDIYIHALEKINSTPNESLFIDDNKTNVDAAIKLGINGFVYTDSDSFNTYIKQLGIDLEK